MTTPSPSRGFSLPEIKTSLLPNGLKIHAVHKDELPLVGIHFVLPWGAESDPAGKAGLADLTAEMLTLGTQRRSAAQWAVDVDALGATLSASSGWESTTLHLSGLSEDWEKLMGLLLEIYTQPAFAGQEFDQLQSRRVAALVQQKDESAVTADERFQEILFRGTPYDHPVYGTLDSVSHLACQEAEEFYRRRFSSGGCFLVVVGDFPVEACFRWAEANFPLADRVPPVRGKEVSPGDPARVRTIFVNRPDLTQSQIRLGHVGIQHAHPDFLPFEVMNYALGAGGFSSRLMQKIRSELGYTYGIRASLEPRKKPGPFLISTFTPTATTLPCVQEILAVVRSFIAEGATDQERSEAVNFFTGSYPLKFETLSQIAQKVIQAEVNGLGLEYLTAYPGRVEAITREEMARAAREHIHPEEMLLLIVGRGAELRAEFERLGPLEMRE
jgi:zinc protease